MSMYDRIRNISEATRENGRRMRESEPPEDFPVFLRSRVPPADHPGLDELEQDVAAVARTVKSKGKTMDDLNSLDGLDALAALFARLSWLDMKKHVTAALGADAPQDQVIKVADNLATWANSRVEELKKEAGQG